MKSKERFILALISLFLLAVSIALIAVAVPLVPIASIRTGLEMFYGNNIFVVLGILFFIVSLIVFAGSFSRGKLDRFASQGGYHGEIRISFSAIESMVLRVIRGHREINEIKTKIATGQDGLNIMLKITVIPETIIPEMIEKLQKTIKEHIEEMTGITVPVVKVLVDRVTAKDS